MLSDPGWVHHLHRKHRPTRGQGRSQCPGPATPGIWTLRPGGTPCSGFSSAAPSKNPSGTTILFLLVPLSVPSHTYAPALTVAGRIEAFTQIWQYWASLAARALIDEPPAEGGTGMYPPVRPDELSGPQHAEAARAGHTAFFPPGSPLNHGLRIAHRVDGSFGALAPHPRARAGGAFLRHKDHHRLPRSGERPARRTPRSRLNRARASKLRPSAPVQAAG